MFLITRFDFWLDLSFRWSLIRSFLREEIEHPKKRCTSLIFILLFGMVDMLWFLHFLLVKLLKVFPKVFVKLSVTTTANTLFHAYIKISVISSNPFWPVKSIMFSQKHDCIFVFAKIDISKKINKWVISFWQTWLILSSSSILTVRREWRNNSSLDVKRLPLK